MSNFSRPGRIPHRAQGTHTCGSGRTRTTADSGKIQSVTPGILTWAKHLAGLRFTNDGQIEEISDAERLAGHRESCAGLKVPGAILAVWINTPAPNHRIDPKSEFSARQIAERERDFDDEGNVESLESALRYDPTVPLARLFLAAALEKNRRTSMPLDAMGAYPQRAAFLRRYDLDALARDEGKMKNEELAALWVRAANHLARASSRTQKSASVPSPP